MLNVFDAECMDRRRMNDDMYGTCKVFGVTRDASAMTTTENVILFNISKRVLYCRTISLMNTIRCILNCF
jgi:hypothetical protein